MKFREYDEDSLLAAVQSATIYVLLRSLEPSADNDLVNFFFRSTGVRSPLGGIFSSY